MGLKTFRKLFKQVDILFSMKNPTDEEVEQFLKDFFSRSRLKKDLTLEDLKKAREESYEKRFSKYFKKKPKKLYPLESLYQKR